MNTAETLYVFHDYGGENSLHPLARYFEAHQLNTYMIDNQVYPCPKEEVFNILAQKRAGRRVVYFTSAHLWFDQHNFEALYPANPDLISALEMMDFLKPDYTVYYPHDLECFFHPVELNWLSLFDLVLLPYKNNLYYQLISRGIKTDIVGWIKKEKEIPFKTDEDWEPYSPVFFPSNIYSFFQTLGAEKYSDWFLQYIPASVPLKMPGNDMRLYPFLNPKGFTFLDGSKSVYDVMAEHNLIIGSGDSSIIFEAALSGIPVISVLDRVFPDEVYLNSLKGIKGVYPLHPEEIKPFLEKINSSRTHLAAGPHILGSFDYSKVLSYVL